MSKSIIDLLSQYITLKRIGKEYATKCVFHDETKPSLFINFEKGVYYCFGCGASGTLLSLIKKITKKRIKDLYIENFLKRNNKEIDLKENVEKNDVQVNINVFPPIDESSKVYKKFLEKRGITFATASIFDIRKGINEWVGRLIFPVYFNGKCVGFTSRAVYSGPPKWFHQPSFDVANYLYGLDLVNGDEVVLVEGVLDVIKLYQEGVVAVGLFGTQINDNRIKLLLQKNIRNVYICLDGDAEEEIKKVYERLKGWFNVKVLKLPKGKDPDDLGKRIFDYAANFEFSL